MIRDVTLGQFFPGKSILHRMDPRAKLVLTFVYIIVLFLARGPVTYGIMFVWLALSIALSEIKLRVILRGLRPVLFILIFTGLLNMFYTPGHVLVTIWFIQITEEGLIAAGYMVVRIIMLIAGTFLLTYTTSPIQLTDAIERLLKPLAKIRLPVHELAMMMTIALRFIPTLLEETEKIMNAQKARGADFESGNIFRRARALVPLLVPLFISAFRRADDLAVAMECRCYHGGEGRTRLRVLHYTRVDAAAAGLVAGLTAAVIVLRTWGW